MLTQAAQEFWAEAKALELENLELKEKIRVLQTEISTKRERPQACKYCKYFYQHYGLFDGEYKEIYAGHCKRGRIRDKKPDATCDYFEMR